MLKFLERINRAMNPIGSVEQAVRERDARDWHDNWKQFSDSYPFSDKEMLDIRAENMLKRIADAPSIGTIVAIRLGAISNTGDVVVWLECIDGRIYQIRCGGHAANQRLIATSVEPAGEYRTLDWKESGGTSFCSVMQRVGDDSPPAWQPHYKLKITHDITRYEDVHGRSRG